jgi:PqqD family protein of HPr-rel-A system
MGLPAWRVPAHSRFHWRSWDDEHVVYHVNSGDTHRFNAVGARALHLLIAAPRTAPELAECLRDEFPGEAEASTLVTVDELVQRFERLGLVEPDA